MKNIIKFSETLNFFTQPGSPITTTVSRISSRTYFKSRKAHHTIKEPQIRLTDRIHCVYPKARSNEPKLQNQQIRRKFRSDGLRRERESKISFINHIDRWGRFLWLPLFSDFFFLFTFDRRNTKATIWSNTETRDSREVENLKWLIHFSAIIHW